MKLTTSAVALTLGLSSSTTVDADKRHRASNLRANQKNTSTFAQKRNQGELQDAGPSDYGWDPQQWNPPQLNPDDQPSYNSHKPHYRQDHQQWNPPQWNPDDQTSDNSHYPHYRQDHQEWNPPPNSVDESAEDWKPAEYWHWKLADDAYDPFVNPFGSDDGEGPVLDPPIVGDNLQTDE
jgi:hypothetical protein